MRIAKTLDDLPVGTQVHIYEGHYSVWDESVMKAHHFEEPRTRKGIVVINSKETESEYACITILLSDTSLFHLPTSEMDFIRSWASHMEIRIVEFIKEEDGAYYLYPLDSLEAVKGK